MIEPQSLADWAKIELGVNNLPWLRGDTFQQLDRGIRYFTLYNRVNRKRKNHRSGVLRRMLQFARVPLTWRLKHMFFGWPVELWAAQIKKRIVIRRSLLTGTALSNEFARPHST